jgi:hypothetical protein
MRIGIVVLATRGYFPLGIRFIKRFMQFYKRDKTIIFYFFSDLNPKEYLPDNYNFVEYIHTTNNNWEEGTDMKFPCIMNLENRDVDYLFYFDADTNVDKPFDENWFLGDMVGGQHYNDQGSMLTEGRPFERNSRSKAYIPHDTGLPQMYFLGAFFGGTKNKMIAFCKVMRSYQLADREWGYEPGVNDESYINCEFHFNPPEKIVLSKDFKFIVSCKGGIGDPRYMDLDVEQIKLELKAARNFPINIQSGKVSIE